VTRTPASAHAFSHGKDSATPTRRRFKQTTSFQDRLTAFIADTRSEADAATHGADRFELLMKINPIKEPA
jgi:hypothetical protein